MALWHAGQMAVSLPPVVNRLLALTEDALAGEHAWRQSVDVDRAVATT